VDSLDQDEPGRSAGEEVNPEDKDGAVSWGRAMEMTQNPVGNLRAFFRLGATAYGGPAMMAYLKAIWSVRAAALRAGVQGGHGPVPGDPGRHHGADGTYTGYRLRGLQGGLAAALGFVLPAFLLMTGLSAAYFAFGELALVKALFRGWVPSSWRSS